MTDEIFLGNGLNGIDAKGRVSVPASFREVLAARSDARTVVLAPAERADCLVGYDSGYPAKVCAEYEARFAGQYSDERDDLFRLFGASERVPIDDNGRIILSSTLKEAGRIDRLALFWSKGDHFEVWNPDHFIARPNLDQRIVRIAQRLIDARGAA